MRQHSLPRVAAARRFETANARRCRSRCAPPQDYLDNKAVALAAYLRALQKIPAVRESAAWAIFFASGARTGLLRVGGPGRRAPV